MGKGVVRADYLHACRKAIQFGCPRGVLVFLIREGQQVGVLGSRDLFGNWGLESLLFIVFLLVLVEFGEISRYYILKRVGHDLGPNDFRYRVALGTVFRPSFKLTDLNQVVQGGAFDAPEYGMLLV